MKEIELFKIEDNLRNQIFNLANIHDVLYKQVDLNKEFGNIHKTTIGAVLKTLEVSRQILKNNCDELTEIRSKIFHSQDCENDYLFEVNSKCFNVIGKCLIITALKETFEFVKRTEVPTTEKEQLKYKTKEMRAKAWNNVEHTLFNNGYSHNSYYFNNDNVFMGTPIEKIDAYNLYINKEWNKLIEYYSKYYVKK